MITALAASTPEAGHQRGVGQEAPVVADRVGHRQAVALPDGEILHPVPWGGVYGASAGIECHMLPEHDRHLPVLQGVLQPQSLQGAALELRQHGSARQAEAPERGFQELGCHDQVAPLAAASRLRERVAKLRPQGDGLIPGSVQGVVVPDHEVHGRRAKLCGAEGRRAPPDRFGRRRETPRRSPVRSSPRTRPRASARAERQSRHQCTGFTPL